MRVLVLEVAEEGASLRGHAYLHLSLAHLEVPFEADLTVYTNSNDEAREPWPADLHTAPR